MVEVRPPPDPQATENTDPIQSSLSFVHECDLHLPLGKHLSGCFLWGTVLCEILKISFRSIVLHSESMLAASDFCM